jgi:xanthine dehydrogenase accessory factor
MYPVFSRAQPAPIGGGIGPSRWAGNEGIIMRPELLTLASTLAAREEAFALVTVVRREPPSSVRVGDAALVTRDGHYHGWVGGGCTRSTVLREALRAIADGEPRLLSLSPDPSSERRPGLIALPITCASGGSVDLYVEPVIPVPRLVLFGTSPAARALARIGHAMGYRIDVVDADADAAAFPEAACVLTELGPEGIRPGAFVLVATMSERDAAAIEAALRSAPAYLGVIASRTRFGELREALLGRGVSPAALHHIAAPAGLDIGARTPEEIALSIMAQMVQRRRTGAEARQEPAQAHAGAPDQPHQATDPVCGMTVTVVGARHTADVEGHRYYFCCAGCRTAFLTDPSRYRTASAIAGAS